MSRPGRLLLLLPLPLPRRLRPRLPFGPSATGPQAATYLLGISLFSIAFLVFLNSAVSFVVTDLLGVREGVGDIVGTLGFVDELVALAACPLWGLASDRLGVRWVAVLGYAVIGLALAAFVQARSVAGLVAGRVVFALGASAAATMVTAALPVLTAGGGGSGDGGELEGDDIADGDRAEDEDSVVVVIDGEAQTIGRDRRDYYGGTGAGRSGHISRGSMATSPLSDATITPELFTRTAMQQSPSSPLSSAPSRLSSHNPSNNNNSRSSSETGSDGDGDGEDAGRNPSALAGYVGFFTGCGALVALVLFLPLPARLSRREGVTPADAITYSFYVVAAVAFLVAGAVFLGFRGLCGEEDKGWRMLLGLRRRRDAAAEGPTASFPSAPASPTAASPPSPSSGSPPQPQEGVPRHRDSSIVSSHRSSSGGGGGGKNSGPLPYRQLLLASLRLGLTDPDIALGYLGGFVARASTVAISLFVPLYVNAYFIGHGFCRHGGGGGDDGGTREPPSSLSSPSPDLKHECRAAYILASALTGAAQLVALLCAPVFGYLSGRAGRHSDRQRQRQRHSSRLARRQDGPDGKAAATGRGGTGRGGIGGGRLRDVISAVNAPVPVAAGLGVVGYVVFPRLASPEIADRDGRGGGPVVLLVVALLGVSQIGAIVCSLGSLGRGVLGGGGEEGRRRWRSRPQRAEEGEREREREREREGGADADADAIGETEALLGGRGGGGSGGDGVNNTRYGTDPPPPPPPSGLSRVGGRRGGGAAPRNSRVHLKGSIAGVYSLCGGGAILLLTKLGGFLFDAASPGAPFYLMAGFNAALLVASLAIDILRGR